MKIEFWVDPICPWCWVTARWIVDEVKQARNLNIIWQPISLLFKNNPDPGTDYHRISRFGLGLLRVMESARHTEGEDAVFDLYWEFGRRIHHDDDRSFDPEVCLTATGYHIDHAQAFNSSKWDAEIRKRMNSGLVLTGEDVGTPIIALKNRDNVKCGYFGPVITRVPPHKDSLLLWDSLVSMMNVEGFWELKRTRTERPQPGKRP